MGRRYVSGLTLLFAAERSTQQESCGCNDDDKKEQAREGKKETKDISSSCFRVPLQYPRYAKEDYEAMSESELDRLLAQYGLPTNGDLNYKKEYAIGAFIWPDFRGQQLVPSASLHSIQDGPTVEFLCRLLGFAR